MSSKYRIMYVDAHLDTAEMMRIMLRFSGVEVVSVHNWDDALSFAKNKDFDLFLLENHLPDGSGVDLCKQLQAIVPHVPVLFFSSLGREVEKQKGFAAGAKGYLIKPNDLDRVPNIVIQTIDNHR
jgi:DNA-binding response OmpR family regulator